MSHIVAWMLVLIACVAAEAAGVSSHDSAAFFMIASLAALALHWVMSRMYTISEVDDDLPHEDLRRDFLKQYFKASDSSLPEDWLQAALAAKRWEIAMGKPAHHIHHKSPRRTA